MRNYAIAVVFLALLSVAAQAQDNNAAAQAATESIASTIGKLEIANANLGAALAEAQKTIAALQKQVDELKAQK